MGSVCCLFVLRYLYEVFFDKAGADIKLMMPGFELRVRQQTAKDSWTISSSLYLLPIETCCFEWEQDSLHPFFA